MVIEDQLVARVIHFEALFTIGCGETNADGGKVGTGFLLVAGYLALCIFSAGPIPADPLMTRFS